MPSLSLTLMQYPIQYSSNVLFMQDYTQNIFPEDSSEKVGYVCLPPLKPVKIRHSFSS